MPHKAQNKHYVVSLCALSWCQFKNNEPTMLTKLGVQKFMHVMKNISEQRIHNSVNVLQEIF